MPTPHSKKVQMQVSRHKDAIRDKRTGNPKVNIAIDPIESRSP